MSPNRGLIRGQQLARLAFKDDDLELDGAGATGAIVLPALPPRFKFTIISAIIQLLNLNGLFRGTTSEYAHQQ
ncbi:hypothetical protein KY285_035898 [Solanum tuberosum]|nr:hypothetical protein KY289_036067 [Solanum tuberosum]KAH0639312.1 hypothetical protein KY285_035898 [Solanum tuberosum]